MHRSSRGWVATAIVAGVLPMMGAPHAAGQKDDLTARITRVEAGLLPPILVRGRTPGRLSDRMKELHVPGVSVAVIRNGRIDWAKGYGLAEAGTARQVTAATRFQAASISKPVAALGTLALVQQGKLSLEEDVNGLLRSWKVPSTELTRAQKVTVSRLLSHTAGLTVHGFPGYAHGTPLPPLTDILNGNRPANTGAVRVAAVPGARWSYSGGGYCVLQQLLIDVSGQPFPEWMRRAVLSPLGMEHSTYEQPLSKPQEALTAAAHRSDGAVIPGRWHDYPEMAAAGLRTTPSDLARFMLEVQKAASGQRGAVLEPETARKMLTRVNGPTGLGLFLAGEGANRRFFHGGSNEGFRCEMVGYVEQGLGAVVMTNADDGDTLAAELLNGIAREYGWPGYLPPERVPLPLEPAALASYAGTYEVNAERKLPVLLRGDRLYLKIENGREFQLYAEAPDRFFIAEAPVQVRFTRDPQGGIAEMVVSGVLQLRGKRVK